MFVFCGGVYTASLASDVWTASLPAPHRPHVREVCPASLFPQTFTPQRRQRSSVGRRSTDPSHRATHCCNTCIFCNTFTLINCHLGNLRTEDKLMRVISHPLESITRSLSFQSVLLLGQTNSDEEAEVPWLLAGCGQCEGWAVMVR